MKTLGTIYLLVCLVVTGWFSTAAYHGWKTVSLLPQQTGPGGSRSPGGIYYFGGSNSYSGGSRSSGGSWGGGK